MLNEELKNINPQGLVDLLLELSKHVDVRKLLDSNSYSKLDNLLSDLEQRKYLLSISQTSFSDIRNSLKCSHCLEHIPDVFLDCGDKICRNCATEIIITKTQGKICINKLEKNLTPCCPICDGPMKSINYSHIFPN